MCSVSEKSEVLAGPHVWVFIMKMSKVGYEGQNVQFNNRKNIYHFWQLSSKENQEWGKDIVDIMVDA